MNNVILIGRLTRDPELKFMPSTGMAITKFTLAVDRELSKEKKTEATSKGQQTADFINITVFNKQAESSANYLSKGSLCAINGKISTGSYTTQSGEKRYTTEVIATKIKFLDKKNEQTNKNNSPSISSPDEMDTSYFEHINEGLDNQFNFEDDDDIPF